MTSYAPGYVEQYKAANGGKMPPDPMLGGVNLKPLGQAIAPALTKPQNTNTISAQQANEFLKANNIKTGMTEAQSMAAINANPTVAAAWKNLTTIPAPSATPAPQAPGIQPLTTSSLNPYQKESLEALGKGTGPLNPNIGANLQKATSAADRLSTPYDPNSYKQFMNPYIDEVISRNASDIGRQYSVNRNQNTEDFARAGGFGSTAEGVARALTNEAEGRQVGDMSAQLRAQGFDTATGRSLDLYGTGLNTAQAQAGLYGNIAGQQQSVDQYGRNVLTTDLNNKLNAGNQIQSQNQRELDAYFAERDRAFNYPYVNADFYGNILNRYPTGTTQTSTQSGVGAIQGALGGGLLGSRIANQNTSTLPWQQTGNVKPSYMGGGYY